MTWTTTLDKITNEASSLSPGRVAATVVTAPFFVVGWLVGIVWLCVALLWSAGVVGFRSARSTRGV